MIPVARGLDPAKTNFTESQWSLLVYDTLVQRSKDGVFEPKLAEAVEAKADFTEWTVRLRPDVKFHDGTVLDAEAVKSHWERIMDPATASPSISQLQSLASIELVDDVTLVATLSAPDSTFIEVLANNPGNIPSPTAVAEFGERFGTSAYDNAIIAAIPVTARGVHLYLRTDSSFNVPFFSNERVDELAAELVTEDHPAIVESLMTEAGEILIDEMPCQPGNTAHMARFFRHNVHGLELWYQNDRIGLVPYEDVWVDN